MVFYMNNYRFFIWFFYMNNYGFFLELGAETYLIRAERFRISSYSRMPKSQTRNRCRNPKPMPKPETDDEIRN